MENSWTKDIILLIIGALIGSFINHYYSNKERKLQNAYIELDKNVERVIELNNQASEAGVKIYNVCQRIISLPKGHHPHEIENFMNLHLLVQVVIDSNNETVRICDEMKYYAPLFSERLHDWIDAYDESIATLRYFTRKYNAGISQKEGVKIAKENKKKLNNLKIFTLSPESVYESVRESKRRHLS